MASSRSLLLLVLGVSLCAAQVKIYSLRASNLPANLISTTDGFVRVFCSETVLGKTSVRDNDENPWWSETFTFFKAQENDVLKLEVYDHDLLFDDLLGVCVRPLKVGTYSHDCFLNKGGTLHYSYDLSPIAQK